MIELTERLSGCQKGYHVYSVKTCVNCNKNFCFNCCEDTNIHEGGKYEKDFMYCPNCGQDYYSDD